MNSIYKRSQLVSGSFTCSIGDAGILCTFTATVAVLPDVRLSFPAMTFENAPLATILETDTSSDLRLLR